MEALVFVFYTPNGRFQKGYLAYEAHVHPHASPTLIDSFASAQGLWCPIFLAPTQPLASWGETREHTQSAPTSLPLCVGWVMEISLLLNMRCQAIH